LRRSGLLDLGLLHQDSVTGVFNIGDNRPCCAPFIDDLAIYSETKKQHLEDVRRVLDCLGKNQYYVKKKKCHFGCKYVLFCGGIVGNGVLAMDPVKIKAVDDWCQPETITELRAFLGMANYLKVWIRNYSESSGVLTNLLKKGMCVRKDWGEEHTAAFLTLKAAFKSYPILRLPDFGKQFYLVTDSCDHAIGGAVCQMYEHEGRKTLMPVAYHSRKMSKHEVNYSVREQECLAVHDCFKKFEYLLLGSPFEVIMHTDHSSLKQVELGGTLQTSKRLARWAEYFGGFAYQVVWIPGDTNLIGDGISRSLTATKGTVPVTSGGGITLPQTCPVDIDYSVGIFKSLDFVKFGESEEFKGVYELLAQGPVDINMYPETRYFERIGERLFYKLPWGGLALCIPEGIRVKVKGVGAKVPLREALLAECHDSVYMGHRGANKTYAQMKKLFYWKKLRKDVGKFVRSCKTCLRAKPSTRGEMGVLKANECPTGPMNSVTVDFMTGLPATVSLMYPGRKITQAVVLVDRFTKKVFGEPLPDDATAEDVARCLYRVVFREHGWPLQIISDQDTKFTGKFWKELFRVAGTKLSFGYAYHQRFDGQTEVMIRVIKEIFRCYIDRDQTNWAEILGEAFQCINNSVNIDTGYSPNEVYYGRQCFRPVELQFQRVVSVPSVEAFLLEGEEKREVATESVRQAIVNYSKQFNVRTPVKLIDPRIKVGSEVFVTAANLVPPNLRGRPSKKLGLKRAGPFKVVERISDTGFRLEMTGYGSRICKTFHARSLTPYEPNLDLEIRTAQATPDHLDDTGQEMFQVEKLTNRRKLGKKIYYFVLYEGYDMAEGEWVLREDLLEDCPDLVKEYEGEKPLSGQVKKVKFKQAVPGKVDIKLTPEPEVVVTSRVGRRSVPVSRYAPVL
jgi:hypothetical protein